MPPLMSIFAHTEHGRWVIIDGPSMCRYRSARRMIAFCSAYEASISLALAAGRAELFAQTSVSSAMPQTRRHFICSPWPECDGPSR